ncbi:MAG: hypothetical protein A3F72_01805 [Bacteroidetes bacterium RIFCSPLOWO2_12_FULL_35_15]|nr:MAG: hypothetical protein A3F72_01805 [Bacteroidetes bacterium RIFCSPLOWO2_12_FULL_35_15]
MLLIVDLLLLGCLGIVVFQDFKHRQISWLLIPTIFVAFVGKALLVIGVNSSLIINTIWNSTFILIQIVLLTVYMSIKNKKLVNIVNTYLGIGDVLFFIVLCAAFSPVNYIVFYLASTLLTLIGFLFYNIISKKATREIPLAGAMAGGLLILIIVNRIKPQLNFYNDDFLLNIISTL